MRIEETQPTFLHLINRQNIEDQDERNRQNLVDAKKWQEQLEDLRAMERGYNLSKLPMSTVEFYA
jgi:predicted ATPase